MSSVAHSYSHLFILLYATVVLVLEGSFGGMTYADLQWLSLPGFVLYGVAALPAGLLGDRWSATGMMAVFFIGVGLSSILTGLASGPVGLLIGLAAIGLFSSIYHPVGIAWLVKHAVNRGRALGINGVFGNLGTGAAAILAGALADTFGWRVAFIVPGTIALITGLVFLWAVRKGWVVEMEADAKTIPAAPAADVRRVFFAMAVTVICVGLIFQTTSVGLPKIFSDRLGGAGATAMGAGILVSIVYFIAAGSQIIGGELADRYPLNRVLHLQHRPRRPRHPDGGAERRRPARGERPAGALYPARLARAHLWPQVRGDLGRGDAWCCPDPGDLGLDRFARCAAAVHRRVRIGVYGGGGVAAD